MSKKNKKAAITSETILQRDKEQEFTYIDGEVVMLSLKNGEYYGLDSVGTRIWELLEEEILFSDLVRQLMNEFDVHEDLCLSDTKGYLSQLMEKDLLIVKE